jgi:hypothetical protein
MVGRWFQRWRRSTPIVPGTQPPSGDASSPPAAAPSAPEPSSSSAPDPPTQSAISPGDLANAAIERLAEDESLRGDLTDDGYQPLQDWAVARLQRIAHEAAHHPDPQAAMDGFTEQIRAFVRAAVQAAEDGTLGDLPEQVKPRVVLKDDMPAVVDALKKITFTNDADANAKAIADALAATTSKENRA